MPRTAAILVAFAICALLEGARRWAFQTQWGGWLDPAQTATNEEAHHDELVEHVQWFRRTFPHEASEYANRRRFAATMQRTVFLVLASKTANVSWVQNAWGKRVPRASLAFIGECAGCDYAVPSREADTYGNLWAKMRDVLRDAPTRFSRADFFVKLDLDTFVIPEHLAVWLGSLDNSKPMYCGWPWRLKSANGLVESTYASGGAGYMINRRALLLTRAMQLPACAAYSNGSAQHTVGYEDVFISRCLAAAGVTLTRSKIFNAETWPWLVNDALYGDGAPLPLRILQLQTLGTLHDAQLKRHASAHERMDLLFRSRVVRGVHFPLRPLSG